MMKRLLILTSVSVDLSVIVLDELFYKSTVLVQNLVSHVGNVMEHRLILHLMQKSKTDTQSRLWLKWSQPLTNHSCYCYMFTHTMKFCCSGDHEYMTGTEATALRVFRGMICLANSEKPLSTVHCTGQQRQGTVRTLSLDLHRGFSYMSVYTCWPLGCLLRSRQTSWCELAVFAWSSIPGSKCQFAPWFSDGWCWTCSGRVTRNFNLPKKTKDKKHNSQNVPSFDGCWCLKCVWLLMYRSRFPQVPAASITSAPSGPFHTMCMCWATLAYLTLRCTDWFLTS